MKSLNESERYCPTTGAKCPYADFVCRYCKEKNE